MIEEGPSKTGTAPRGLACGIEASSRGGSLLIPVARDQIDLW